MKDTIFLSINFDYMVSEPWKVWVRVSPCLDVHPLSQVGLLGIGLGSGLSGCLFLRE